MDWIKYEGEKKKKEDLFDKVRVRDEAARAPERVKDVGAKGLELGSKTTIDDQATTSPLYELLDGAPSQTHIIKHL